MGGVSSPAAPLASGLTSAQARSAASPTLETQHVPSVLSSEASSVGQVTGCAFSENLGSPCGAPGAGWWGARPVAPLGCIPTRCAALITGCPQHGGRTMATQSSVPTMGRPQEDAGEGCTGRAGGV